VIKLFRDDLQSEGPDGTQLVTLGTVIGSVIGRLYLAASVIGQIYLSSSVIGSRYFSLWFCF